MLIKKFRAELEKLQFSLHSFPLGSRWCSEMFEQSLPYGGKCGICWHRDGCLLAGSSQNIHLVPPPQLCLPAVGVFFSSTSAEWINAGNTWTHTVTWWCTNEGNLIEPIIVQKCHNCKEFFNCKGCRRKHTVMICVFQVFHIEFTLILMSFFFFPEEEISEEDWGKQAVQECS